MTEPTRETTFNSPLETGVRSLAILLAAFPRDYDLQRLVEMDYLVVHSGDANGPASLHAALPLRAGELLVRRGLVERGVMLMASRGLVERKIGGAGITYCAAESANAFFSMLQSEYILLLKSRAEWAVDLFGRYTGEEIRAITRNFFEGWGSQFQPTSARLIP